MAFETDDASIDIGGKTAVVVVPGLCELIVRLVAHGRDGGSFNPSALGRLLRQSESDLKNVTITGVAPAEEVALVREALGAFRSMASAAIAVGSRRPE